MIETFSHKALKALWESGETKKLPPECIKRLHKILKLIDAMANIADLGAFAQTYRLHELKKPPYKGFWSMDVTGNFRVIFRLSNGNVYDVNFLDTH